MKKILMLCVLLGILSAGISVLAENPPAKGDVMPNVMLPAPKAAEHQEYLGITGKDKFSISDIKADLIIIEIFSMYCPHCQREAPMVNDLYKTIEANDKLKTRVKMIGIGVGNTDFEVEFFKKQYSVLFPLFSDGDYSLHEKLGKARTPYFMIVKTADSKVIYSNLGEIKDRDAFLNHLGN